MLRVAYCVFGIVVAHAGRSSEHATRITQLVPLMILHSIKWRLQLWHALMLVIVLSGFGFTAYQLDRVSRFQRIDRELNHRAGVVLNALQAGGRARPGGPQNGPNPGRPPEFSPGDRPPEQNQDSREGLIPPRRGPRLSERDLNLFAGEPDAFYFTLFHREGHALLKSDSAPDDVPRPVSGGSNNLTRLRGTMREFISFTPPGEVIVTGYDVSTELAELRRLGWKLFAAGSGVLLLGLAGGWWMATRAIRPIKDISATAARISGSDLTQRITITDAEGELGQLAAVLNSTFDRLDNAFAQQHQFISDAAHELRTPVSVILTQAQSTLNKERTPAEYRETLESCQRAGQRMRKLIEALLGLARLDAGQASGKREPLDLAKCAAECLDLVRPLATERKVKLHGELGSAFCTGDSEQLTLVITNLLSNAIHHSREGGEVRVTTRFENQTVNVTVADNGTGIAPEHLPHIFDRFYRADAARTSSQGRTGLGLAISKSIIESHGGTIEVTSEPGKGSSFTVKLSA